MGSDKDSYVNIVCPEVVKVDTTLRFGMTLGSIISVLTKNGKERMKVKGSI